MFSIKVRCIVSEEGRQRNIELSETGKYPAPTGTGRLAVVAGGPSLISALPRLRQWQGDIWGVNEAAAFLIERGIPATFYTVDPGDGIEGMCGDAKCAVLADHCSPLLYEALAGRTIYRVHRAFDGPGPTSAVAASLIALRAGYDGVSFFGCDSSYVTASHAYRDDDVPSLMRVRCGPREFLTKPEFILQAQELASIIRHFPTIFSNESGGLLAAMVQDDAFEVVDVSRHMIIERKSCAPAAS